MEAAATSATLAPDHGGAIGRIVSVTGSQAVVLLDGQPAAGGGAGGPRAELGTLMKVETPSSVLFGLVSALSVPVPSQKDGEPEIRVAELELVGEIIKGDADTGPSFLRGVSIYPSLGDPVRAATAQELRQVYLRASESAVQIGSLRQDPSIPAMVQVNELLGKHFAVLGSTGTGKSCGVALILRAILRNSPNAHILLLDPHNEYASSFGRAAEIITPENLQLPFWFLTFDEIVEIVMGDQSEKEAEVEILAELIPAAKSRYAANLGRDKGIVLKKRLNEVGSFTVDTPVPYRISDLLALIDLQLGRLENKKDLAPYRQLKARIETISQDPRFGFMFGSLTVQDQMASIIGRLFRVPVAGKPISILELAGMPPGVVNVVVSVICRMTFDFALWCDGNVPITLVCEEAHRYVPNDARLGFEPARRAISRVAKEGRKYGVSLCVVSQRPAELDPTILSQCSTVFAMRLANERDQDIVRAAIFDTAASLLDFLPSLGTREAIVFGDGIALPGRIRFDDLPEEAMPGARTARFTDKWRQSLGEEAFLAMVVERWRAAGSPIDSLAEIEEEDAAAGEAAAEDGPQADAEPPPGPGGQAPPNGPASVQQPSPVAPNNGSAR